MATIPVIPGVKVATKGVLNKPLKDIICAILFGGINNMLKGNLLCIQANLAELAGNPNLPADLKAALADLKKELEAFQEHIGITETLKRINGAIADIQKVLALGGMCPIPLKAPKIPNMINDVAGTFFGAANGIINQLGQLAKPQLCLDAKGGINTGSYKPGSILDQINRNLDRIAGAPQASIDKFVRSINGVTKAIRSQIDRELFPDFRHKHNLITGKNTVGNEAAITVGDVSDAYDQAQSLVSAVNSTGSFPVTCATPGTGARVSVTVSGGLITAVELVNLYRSDLYQFVAEASDGSISNGFGAVFNVYGDLGQPYQAKFVDGGMNYAVGDRITISGLDIGGDTTSTANDLIISVTKVTSEGTVTEFSVASGTVNVPVYEGYTSATVDLSTINAAVTDADMALLSPSFDNNGYLTGYEVTVEGANYTDGTHTLPVVDEGGLACPEGVQSPNMWINALGPEVYGLAVAALTSADPAFARQEPVYDYCGRLIGYDEVLLSGDSTAIGGDPLDGAITDPLEISYEFTWIDAPDEGRVGWGVTGVEAEQLVGPAGAQRLTTALILNPEIVLYRGQAHMFSIPSGLTQEFYICEVDPTTLTPVVEGGQVRLFSQGLYRFETGEYFDDANGRDENAETWTGATIDGSASTEPNVWRRQELYPNGSTLMFQIGEADADLGLDHWPDYLAYSNRDGTKFGLFRLV